MTSWPIGNTIEAIGNSIKTHRNTAESMATFNEPIGYTIDTIVIAEPQQMQDENIGW